MRKNDAIKNDNNPYAIKVYISELEREVERLKKDLGKAEGQIKKLNKIIDTKPHYKKKYRLHEIYEHSKTHTMWETREYFNCSKSTYYRAIRECKKKGVSKP